MSFAGTKVDLTTATAADPNAGIHSYRQSRRLGYGDWVTVDKALWPA
jgi:hypothetical protein